MKLIVIYGPPASGKLTIASGLAEKKGYKLFHNHLTVDLLKELLKFGTPEFFELNQNLKLDLLEATAKQGLVEGVIYTFVYDKKTDGPFVEKLQQVMTENNSEVIFIQIYCEKDELLNRVTEESRKKYKKVQSKEGLTKYLESGDFVSPITGVKSHKIDSTHLTPEQTIEEVLNKITN